VTQLTGLNLTPLNKDVNSVTKALAFNTARVMAFNLSSMIQVRPTTSTGAATGWRNGYKVHLLSIRVDVRGAIKNPQVDCKYHLWVCRKKDGIRPDYHTPTMLLTPGTDLFRVNTGGPFSTDALNAAYPTLDKKNTESWSWPEGMKDEKSVSMAAEDGGIRGLHLGFYKKFDTVWEFNTDRPSADNALKDGDYTLFFFREGPADMQAIDSALNIDIDIAFKDV
jgi:hypothetical protein